MKIRILIIDNEPRWIQFVKQDLNSFEIVTAHDIIEATDELEKNNFELVIASANNLDILKIISDKYSDKHVIVTTINPSVEEALDAYRLGAIRYIPKSFGKSDLLNKVHDVIPNASPLRIDYLEGDHGTTCA
jgi:DNA-binding NtrC family response regulator